MSCMGYVAAVLSFAHNCYSCLCCGCCIQAVPDLSDAELKRLFSALDVDETGSVDFQEFFAGVLQVALKPSHTLDLLEASFKSLDRSGH